MTLPAKAGWQYSGHQSQHLFIFVGLTPGQKISNPSDEINAIPGWNTCNFLHTDEHKKTNFVRTELDASFTEAVNASYNKNMLNNPVAL